MDRKIEIQSYPDREKILPDLETLRVEKFKEGFTNSKKRKETIS
ncbi:hypothetical protein [Leptospira ainazelensis]|nr:hypothetical protein [Leptospira ainazelensis]